MESMGDNPDGRQAAAGSPQSTSELSAGPSRQGRGFTHPGGGIKAHCVLIAFQMCSSWEQSDDVPLGLPLGRCLGATTTPTVHRQQHPGSQIS